MVEITAVRLLEMDVAGRSGDVLAKFPHNKGSGVILEKDCKIEAEIDGKWETLWEARISNNLKYGPEDKNQLNKERTLAELIELIRTYKKYLMAAVSNGFKNREKGKIEGLVIAFNAIASTGEFSPRIMELCKMKEDILKEI